MPHIRLVLQELEEFTVVVEAMSEVLQDLTCTLLLGWVSWFLLLRQYDLFCVVQVVVG